MMDDKGTWWEKFVESAKTLPALEAGVAIHEAFAAAPEGEVVTHLDWDVFMPSGVFRFGSTDAQPQNLPKCTVLLFPLIWHAADIAFIERETGRQAIGRGSYIELVQIAKSPG